jgi:predicted nucleic acid-binding protein
MIVLDTNIISELMRLTPNPGAVAWVTAQPRAILHTTYINQAGVFCRDRASAGEPAAYGIDGDRTE